MSIHLPDGGKAGDILLPDGRRVISAYSPGRDLYYEYDAAPSDPYYQNVIVLLDDKHPTDGSKYHGALSSGAAPVITNWVEGTGWVHGANTGLFIAVDEANEQDFWVSDNNSTFTMEWKILQPTSSQSNFILSNSRGYIYADTDSKSWWLGLDTADYWISRLKDKTFPGIPWAGTTSTGQRKYGGQIVDCCYQQSPSGVCCWMNGTVVTQTQAFIAANGLTPFMAFASRYKDTGPLGMVLGYKQNQGNNTLTYSTSGIAVHRLRITNGIERYPRNQPYTPDEVWPRR